MVEIILKYDGKSETIAVASKWDELTEDQLLYVAKYWEAWRLLMQNNESLLKVKALLFLELMTENTVFNRKKRIDLIAQLGSEQQYQLTQLTNFVFESNGLLKCPIKCISSAFKKLYPPNDRLANLKGGEFMFADDFFVKYIDKGKVEDLDLLIACLYRPLQWRSKNRIAFDKDLIEKSLPTINKLSYAQKQLIVLWYRACRKIIVAENAEVFSNENQSSAKNKGWLSVILAMSGDKFGTFEQTALTDLHLIFEELKDLKERVKPKTK